MNPDSLLCKDRHYVWHPFTQMKDYAKEDHILITRAKGIKLYDADGNGYDDTISSWWCNLHGHNHPLINQAIARQLKKIDHVMFAGFTHEGAIRLAERLVSLTPANLTKVFYSDDGSTAVEVGLKMALQYWANRGQKSKTRYISLNAAYHGDTVGAMSVSGEGVFNRPFKPLFVDRFQAPSPYCYRCPANQFDPAKCQLECLKKIERILKKQSDRIAAMIIEPMVMAAGGMIIYPAKYLKRVAELCKTHDVLFMVDEVATGFGRTGKMFAIEHAGVKPDIMCLSKGITAGYLPFGATLTTEKIYKAFYAPYGQYKTFYHGHTHTGNAISCAVALASLDIFEKNGVLEHVNEVAPYFQKELKRFSGIPQTGDVRGLGLIGAVELVADRKSRRPFSAKTRLGFKIYKAGLRSGLLLRPLGDIIYFFLPLCVTRRQIKSIMDRAYAAVNTVLSS